MNKTKADVSKPNNEITGHLP